MFARPRLKTSMVILAMTLVVLYGYGCHLIFSGVQNEGNVVRVQHFECPKSWAEIGFLGYLPY